MFSGTEELRGRDVDFPVLVAGGAGVIGEQGGTTLSKKLCRAAKK